MNILVTGGCGFIGSHFIRTWYRTDVMQAMGFNQQKHRLVNVDNLSYAVNPEGLEAVASEPSYVFVHEDICHEEAVLTVLQQYQIDTVVHFAAQTHVDRSIQSVEPFVQSNVLGTLSLLKAIQRYLQNNLSLKQKFKLLYVSTDEVYGSLPAEAAPATEYSPLKPSNPYASSKAAGEHFVQAWFNTYGVPSMITRCGNNYGAYQYPEKLIPLMLTRALAEEPLPIYGTGLQVRDWIAVEDHCTAIRLVLREGKLGEIYNIGASNEVSNLSVVHQLCAILDELHPRVNGASYRELITHVSDRLGHDQRYALDTSKLQALGWRTEIDFSAGLRALVASNLQQNEV